MTGKLNLAKKDFVSDQEVRWCPGCADFAILATVQKVTVGRVVGPESVIDSGLAGGETVVTNGHLQLTNGARVQIRERKAGA